MSQPINDTWLEDLQDRVYDLQDQMLEKDWLQLRHDVNEMISNGMWEEADEKVAKEYFKLHPRYTENDYTNGLIFGNLNQQKGSR